MVSLNELARPRRVKGPSQEIYRTHIDLESTLARLDRVSGSAGKSFLEVRRDLRRKLGHVVYMKGLAKANIGNRGGVQIHSANDASKDALIKLLKANAVYEQGQDSTWVQTMRTPGRRFLLIQADLLSRIVGPVKISVLDGSTRDTSKEPANLLGRTPAKNLFELLEETDRWIVKPKS